MGNAQDKPPGSGGGGGRSNQAAAGNGTRSRVGSTVEKPQSQRAAAKGAANGSRSENSPAGGREQQGSPAADASYLDAPAGALPPHLGRLKNAGNHLFKCGQFGDALEKYTEAIDGCAEAGIDSPEDLCILYSNRAACFLKNGNSSDCIQDCNKALELQPYSLKALLRRAMAYESLERYIKAYVDYKTILQIDTSVQTAHDSVHRDKPISAEVAQARAARATQEEARRKETSFTLLKREGNELVKNGNFQEALKKYSECLALKPDECSLYTNRAICLLRLNRFEEAKQDCDVALQMEPGNKKAYYRRALAFKGLQDYLSASSDLQEVLHLDPKVQEAEQELEVVTSLLRKSLMDNTSQAPRV
ncbi:Sperm-associated antigen 1A [Liparis tanakae]|uniref:Sperm-associated antigen 1A n=1 Tax=Liparis tanakae TaxID=230148 RepID=A0A4Z2I328_9TELE|nr:Sperm-associated antigen 1A [Liparis tanakae]